MTSPTRLLAPSDGLLPRQASWMRRWALALLAFGLCALPTTATATELELVLRGGPFIPSDGEGVLDPLGVQGGATALLRLGDHFALGGMVDVARIGWNAVGSSDGVVVEGLGFPDPDGNIQSTLHALALRWYPLSPSTWVPYLELDAGYVSVFEKPNHPDCGDGSGISGQLALGLDWSWTSWVRVGGFTTARLFRMGRGCNAIYYEGMPPSPPHGRLAVSAQLAVTTVWSPL